MGEKNKQVVHKERNHLFCLSISSKVWFRPEILNLSGNISSNQAARGKNPCMPYPLQQASAVISKQASPRAGGGKHRCRGLGHRPSTAMPKKTKTCLWGLGRENIQVERCC